MLLNLKFQCALHYKISILYSCNAMSIKSNENKYSFVMLKIKAAQVKSDTHVIEVSLGIFMLRQTRRN